MINTAKLLSGAVPLHLCYQSLDAFEAIMDDNTQHLRDRQPRNTPDMPGSWPNEYWRCRPTSPDAFSAGVLISAYRMTPGVHAGMVTLVADIPASHQTQIGINAGERVSSFALIVLVFDFYQGTKIVSGLMPAAFSSPG